MKKRSIYISGHSTSISLEEPFWEALREIARSRNMSVNKIATELDARREGNLSSAIRVYVLEWYRQNNG